MSSCHPVLFVTGEYPPMVGGVGAYTERLAGALAARGWRATIFTSERARSAGAQPVGAQQVPRCSEGAESHAPVVYPYRGRWNGRIWQAVAKTAREVEADWIHVQYQTVAYGMNPAVNLAPFWWRRAGFRVAWTYHDLAVPYLFPKAGLLRPWITRLPAQSCDLTIVTNEADRLELNGRARRLAKIPIGSNILARVVPEEERLLRRRAHGFGDSDLVLGYFGFLNRRKGGATLLHTLQRLRQQHRDVWLLMVGDQLGASDPFNVAYLQEVGALAAELGIADRIVRTGYLPAADVSGELAACDVLVMPYEEGASLRHGTLMAALAHGCAVITTTPGHPLPELVDGRDLLYAPPGDAAAAAEAVQRIVAQPDLAATLRAHARERSRLFTWEAIAKEHERWMVL
jgi:glycosyltransferase involved in cell wall biosynthesis